MALSEEMKSILEVKRKFLNECPYYKYLNIEIAEFNETGCVAKMKAGDNHLNALGNIHGGALASLADVACGASLLVLLDAQSAVVAQNIMVNYLLPANKGMLTAKGRIIHKGNRSGVLEADIFNEAGEKVAHAQTTHVIINRKPAGA